MSGWWRDTPEARAAYEHEFVKVTAAEERYDALKMSRAPWWMCNGWWSPWCVLDIVTRCKVKAICDRHDASIMGCRVLDVP